MFIHSIVIVSCIILPLLAAIPHCPDPWRQAFPSEDAPQLCTAAGECAGATNPICVFSIRAFRKVCCQDIPGSSLNYTEPPMCPAGFTAAGAGTQCKPNARNACSTDARCMPAASFANVTGIYICCKQATRTGSLLTAFETEGIVPSILSRYPERLPSGSSFSVAFDTVTLRDGQRFIFNDTDRSKVVGSSFKITYKYPRTRPVVNGSTPGEQFLLIIIQPDIDNRLKPVKRTSPAFVAELALEPDKLVSGVATIEFTQSTASPIVAASITTPTAHPAQPYNRYAIMLFKKVIKQPTTPPTPTIKEFGESLPAPYKIPSASTGLWDVKGYLDKLAAARYIESTTPIAGLVYLVQSTAT